MNDIIPEFLKAYEPIGVEDAIYKKWMDSGYFTPENLPDFADRTEVFSIAMPPPNVTGTLHIGHATMLAIEDSMVRFARLSGKKALWVPGTDHAAIATQSKVEKMIFEAEGKTRHDLGRPEFLRRVNEFAQNSHDTIVNQCKKMGSSLDWSREAYTLDTERNKAVNVAFKRMFEDGLIYRGDRIVNWDPLMQTTVSDDELERKESKAPFYYLKYGPFVIGTARPETKFGDKYVVMHPADERYAAYEHGQKIELEWIQGPITATVIKDEAADPEFGTGVMTITPWHDAVDFAIAERHGLDKEQIIDDNGKLLAIAGEFSGQPIKIARKNIIEKLAEKGLVDHIDEDYVHNIALNSRGGGIIEPQIKKQWFVAVNKEFTRDGAMTTLKQLMQNAVRSREVTIVPDRFEKTYFHWIDNLRDWNISRQIWFGHRVPVWYKNEEMMIGEAPTGEGWEQDPDTLDTWFSSGLWTFSTLGWPTSLAPDMCYHPTTVLETGYDILFFWVARMILMSTYLLGEVPFKTVYLHGLVRDEQGRKMSKSLGNIIDPLDMISKYGADATRLSLIIGGTPGNDTRLSEEKIAGFRNFTNKLWNISRFVDMQTADVGHDQRGGGGLRHVATMPIAVTLADKWILGKFASVVEKVTQYQASYQLSLAGELLREFTWTDFADWYLEIAKVEKGKDDMLNYILERLLILWHPFMPFVTEEIYARFNNGLIIVAKWPVMDAETAANNPFIFGGTTQDYNNRGEAMSARSIEEEFVKLQEVIVAIRNLRAENNIPPKQLVEIAVSDRALLMYDSIIMALAKVSNIGTDDDRSKQEVSTVAAGVEIYVILDGLIDTVKEIARIQNELAGLQKYIELQTVKLDNADFVQRAPEKVIAVERVKLAEALDKAAKLEQQLVSMK